jgi:hypothetical protein
VIEAPKAAQPAAVEGGKAAKREKPAREPKPRKSLQAKMALMVGAPVKRLERVARVLEAASADDTAARTTLAAVKEVLSYLGEAKALVGALPADWKPAGRVSGVKSDGFKPGDRVEVLARWREDLKGALEREEMDNLEVVKVSDDGKRVVVKTADGLRTVIHAARICEIGGNSRREQRAEERAQRGGRGAKIEGATE